MLSAFQWIHNTLWEFPAFPAVQLIVCWWFLWLPRLILREDCEFSIFRLTLDSPRLGSCILPRGILGVISVVCTSVIVSPFLQCQLFLTDPFAVIISKLSMIIFYRFYHRALHSLHRVLFAGFHSFLGAIRTTSIGCLGFRGFFGGSRCSSLALLAIFRPFIWSKGIWRASFESVWVMPTF